MSLYVPLLIQLEVKNGAKAIDFEENSSLGMEESPSITENTRRRLMSGMSKLTRRTPPGGDKNTDAPLAPGLRPRNNVNTERVPFRGRRTYSEVVVENIEMDRQSEASSSSKTKAMSEGPWDVDTLKYYYGNPGIEKTEGILHFYKYSPEKLAEGAACRMLCMMGVPAHVAASDLVSFIGSHLTTIQRLKIVRDNTPNQYFVIIKFKTHKDTVNFFEEFNGVLFNSLEPETCSLLFVDKIECVDEEEPLDLSGLQEMPTCAVCLERMDDSVLSVLCNHTFHATCLQKWKDTVCPVCRYIQTPELVAEQRCADCGQSTDLWTCLICGNVGCGRYVEGHAYRHYEQTSHTFCLKIGGVQVWDYAGDNYVHRLIQTDTEGKFVEYSRGHEDGEQSGDKDLKMDSLKMEYTCLLSSQLESQRKYFESRVADVEQAMKNMEKTSQAQLEVLQKELSQQSEQLKQQKEELTACQLAKTTVEKKQAQNNQKITKLTSELNEERSMNNVLRGDQQKWKQQLEKVTEEKAIMEKLYTTKITDLQEQLNDMMLHFEAQAKLQEQIDKGNIAANDVAGVGVSTPERESKNRRRSHKK